MITVRHLFTIFCAITGACTSLPVLLHAQRIALPDTAFVTYYPDRIMARIYAAQKYTQFTLPSTAAQTDPDYRSNSKLNAGVGATYKNVTLNISYGVSSGEEKGKTKGIDFQSNITPYGWVIDVLASFRKGNYLHPKGYASTPNAYYYRPDVNMDIIGLAGYRVANAKRFSYRAALVQNEWQTRSAGSLLYGAEVYYQVIKGDSALIPVAVQNGFLQAGVNHIKSIGAGPGLGYAYTLVIAKHFFITGSVIGNVTLNLLTEKRISEEFKKTGITPSGIYKGAIGYNSNTWSLSANIAGSMLWPTGALSSKKYTYNTGAIRVLLAKKLGYRS